MRETAYLPWGGAGAYGYAAGVLSGLATYTLAVKVADWPTVGGAYNAIVEAVDGTVTATNGSNNCILTVCNNGNGVYARGAKSDGSGSWGPTTSPALALAVSKVVAITRTPSAISLRVVSGGAVEYSSTGAPAVARDALHAAFGGQIDHLFAVCVATQPGVAKQIAGIVTTTDATDAELIAWLAANDARGKLAGLRNYWPSAGAVGASIPDVVGAYPMTLSGITASALVPL